MTVAAPEGSNRGLWVGVALGLPVIVYGVRGALVDRADTEPVSLVRWIVGSAIVHDLVFLPAVLGVGWLAHRLVPDRWWPSVRWALLTSGVLALIAWPFVRGYGLSADNPSRFPRNYAGGLLVYVVAVWVVALAWGWWTTRPPRPSG